MTVLNPVNDSLFGYDIRPNVRRGLSIPSITVLDESGKIIEEEQRKVFQYNAQEGR